MITRTVTEKVRSILQNDLKARDDDRYLIAVVWQNQALEENLNQANFLSNFKQGRYHLAESIRRARQGLQRKHPELRGQKWNKRHGMADQVKEDLKTLGL